MAVLDIARMGNPILSRRAAEVTDPTAPGIRRLVSHMLETMDYAGGTGLAAPQVHVPLRVVVFFVEAERAKAAEAENEPAIANGGVPLTVLINPLVEVTDPTPLTGLEACLSLPGLTGEVPRPSAIRYRGLTLEGREIAREAQSFHARVVLHECDHLDGILYPQRMTDLARLSFSSELERLSRRAPVEA